MAIGIDGRSVSWFGTGNVAPVFLVSIGGELAEDPEDGIFVRYLTKTLQPAVALASCFVQFDPSNCWKCSVDIRPLTIEERKKVSIKMGEVIKLDSDSYNHLVNGAHDGYQRSESLSSD